VVLTHTRRKKKMRTLDEYEPEDETTMVTMHKIVSETDSGRVENALDRLVNDGWTIHGEIQLAMSGVHTRHSVLLTKQREWDPDID
jgi:hypothetical protein